MAKVREEFLKLFFTNSSKLRTLHKILPSLFLSERKKEGRKEGKKKEKRKKEGKVNDLPIASSHVEAGIA